MPQVTLVTGVSGSGKSTLVRQLAEKYPSRIAVPVAFTTRAARDGETYGVDYYFSSRRQYRQFQSEGILLTDIVYNRYRYGYSRGEFARALSSGRRILCVTDRNNVEPIKAVYPDTATMWLDVDPAEQEERLRRRESPKVVAQRLAISEVERKWAKQKSYLLTCVPLNSTSQERLDLLEHIVFDDG